MKKWISLLLSALLTFGFVGCDKEKEGVTTMTNEIFPKKTEMQIDGQLYTAGAAQFPPFLWLTPNVERYTPLDREELGVEGYFIDSVQGTKVFAFVGIPKTASAENPVPGIVLVHGGGGTAFAEWVAFWVNRGYAAIAMDTDGNMPVESSAMSNVDHTESIYPHGPANFGFADYYRSVEEQWPYHGIASVIVCNSFLRSLEGVDGNRIGLTGISYGSFLTCQAAAYDDRFCFAAPVYGSLDQAAGDTAWKKVMQGRTAELWDNNVILTGNKTPFLYINSNIDPHFSVISTALSDEKTEYSQMLLKYGMLHSHEIGGMYVQELFTFADNICFGKAGLLQITSQPTANHSVAQVKCPKNVEVALVTGYYATEDVLNENTRWKWVEGTYKNGNAEVSIPDNATYYFINVGDNRGLEISTRVIKL